MIVGIDEVGRGPWAGPLVFGAVVLGDVDMDGLTDSKKLSPKQRATLSTLIKEQAVSHNLGWVHADELDEIGLAAALRLACRRALEGIDVSYDQIILDGTVNLLADTGKGPYVSTLAKADSLVASVSAASIIAKVARDTWMVEQDKLYPGYGFAAHKGYGTGIHSTAMQKLGLTPLHRRSFAPVARIAEVQDASRLNAKDTITTKVIGDLAEDVVATLLESNGHKIVERNWKTRWCEVDIISLHENTLYFTEVKYRRAASHGDGFAAITNKKLRQMKFAAELYGGKSLLRHHDIRLAAAAVSGRPPIVDDWLVLGA